MKKYDIRTSILIIILAFIFVIPLIFTFTNSFMSRGEINDHYSNYSSVSEAGEYFSFKTIPDQFSLAQYYEILISKSKFIRMLWNSIFYTVPIVVFHVIVSTMAAFIFAKMEFRFKEQIFFIYIVLMLMPFQVILVPNYLVLEKMNLINNMLSIILPGIFNAFGVFLLRQFMASIPDEVIEASLVDGCSIFGVFRHIILPNVKSGIAALSILTFIDTWNLVEQPLIFLNDTDKYPMSLYLSSLRSSELGISFAASIIFMIPVLLLFLYGEQYLIDGITHTAIRK